MPKSRTNASKRKIIYGVGINDADYEVYKCRRVDGVMVVDWVCPYYSRWLDMIRRCYSSKQKSKQVNYKHCTTSEEWKTFSNFKAWMETQDWEGKQLDKDLKVSGNTVYSSQNCMFISAKLNSFIVKKPITELPMGVGKSTKTSKYLYRCRIIMPSGRESTLGTGDNPYKLHELWIRAKKLNLEVLVGDDRSLSQISRDWFNALVEESELNYNLYLEDLKYA